MNDRKEKARLNQVGFFFVTEAFKAARFILKLFEFVENPVETVMLRQAKHDRFY
ncbi:hypothetical protein [Hymenobacter terrenus]|uniref:hypothetical protein n=1 Tax=Hymenobacter terrenus TaxID=1629124 RepID=UPI000AD822C3|nr:hypothetical protein [Hymenobacter terrenus]